MMNKKLINMILCIFIIILLFYTYNNIENLKTTNHLYNDYVEVDGNIYLYKNEKYHKIGNFNKVNLELDNYNENGYYNIKNTDFYVNYKDIKVIDKIKHLQSKYQPFNKDIVTKNHFKLYKDNHMIAEIHQTMTFQYYMTDKKYYYIEYLNDIYQIEKTDINQLIDNQNEITDYIPVLNFEDISTDSCYHHCIRQNRMDELLNYLKENNYHTITIDDYNKWIQGNIVEPKKTILILSNNEIATDFIINKKDSNFIIDNKASMIHGTNSSYQINNNTNISDFKLILEGTDILNKNIDDTSYASSIPILNYHFFYDKTKGEQLPCHENICEEISTFEKQLSYIKENGFKALTMDEFISWMYGEIELPKKSVLITVDDGAFGTDTHLPNLLNKYQLNATLFLITAWWPKEKYISPYLEIESHGYDIHTVGSCGGGKITCLSKEAAIADLTKSIDILNSSKAFCYPFYSHNALTREEVIASGFKVAFIGESRKASRNDDKYQIPRFPIYDNTSFENFINILN